MYESALQQAIKIAGSERLLAKSIGVPQSRIQYWKSLAKQIPYDKAIAIHLATDGEIDICQLRPDLKNLTKKWRRAIIQHFFIKKNNSASDNLF